MKYELINVEGKDQLDKLYDDSAMTIEGLTTDNESLEYLVNWLIEAGTEPKDDLKIYVTKGKLMNDVYGLTGDNQYKDDLNIVSVMLSDLGNYMPLVTKRFELGIRWFDDVVCNCLYREEEK